MRLHLPLRTASRANEHAHWRTRQKRAKTERQAAWAAMLADPGLRAAMADLESHGLVVGLCRVAPQALDSDNLPTSMKSIRDGIADALRIDDRDARVLWVYTQRRGTVREYAVEATIAAWAP